MSRWKQGHCLFKKQVRPRDYLQIKSVRNYFFIYCFPANISISGSSMTCPNSVIQVDEGQKIAIDGDEVVRVQAHQLGHINGTLIVFNYIQEWPSFSILGGVGMG